MTKVRNLKKYFKYYYLTFYISSQDCVDMSRLYINVCFVGLKQAKALTFTGKIHLQNFHYNLHDISYVICCTYRDNVTQQEHKKKLEYHNCDVGNVCNSL